VERRGSRYNLRRGGDFGDVQMTDDGLNDDIPGQRNKTPIDFKMTDIEPQDNRMF
jgi:hypothetical protein